MTKNFFGKMNFNHILIISIVLCSFHMINSDFTDTKINYDIYVNKFKRFWRKLAKRKLDFTKDTNEICERGSDKLKDYYETSDGEKIGIKEDEGITSGDNPAYIDSLVNLVSGDGDSSEAIKEYIMHLIPVIIFLAIAVLFLPCWLICCICSCAGCCCCNCCKTNKCKCPFYVVSLVIYAFVFCISIYGLSQSNSIFVGLADTECSTLRFIGEVLDGETKETKPKWAGITGITDLLENAKTQIGRLSSETAGNLETAKRAVSGAKTAFEDELQTQSGKINSVEDGQADHHSRRGKPFRVW